MLDRFTWSLVRKVAVSRWALSRWPKRPELDGDEPSTAWGRFRRAGGVSGHAYDAFRRRLTPAGKLLCGIWFSSFVVTRVPGAHLADIAFATISSAMLVAWILSWRRTGLSGTWRMEGRLSAGSSAEIVMELRNEGPRAIRDPGAWFFRFADGLDFPGDGVHVPRLEPGATATLRIPVRGRLRGSAYLAAPHVLAIEPLGLMRSSRPVGAGRVVGVCPGVPRLATFRFLEAGGAGAAFASALGARHDRSGDPSGVRDYREGDSPRDLHHRSWAKRGKPATRERLAGRGDGICLVVSSAAEGIEERMFVDGSLALAACVGLWLSDRGALGEAWLDGVRVPDAGGLAEGLLDACGRIPRVGWRDWERPPLVLPRVDARRPVLVVAPSLPAGTDGWGGCVKAVVPDWSTDSVSHDVQARVLRYRPDLPFSGDLHL